MTPEIPEIIDGFPEITRKEGQNLKAAQQTIAALKQSDALKDTDTALVELVLSTAADVDQMSYADAASGRATLRKTYLVALETLERRAAMNSGRAAGPAENVLEIVQGMGA